MMQLPFDIYYDLTIKYLKSTCECYFAVLMDL